jgi:hypothetical protein
MSENKSYRVVLERERRFADHQTFHVQAKSAVDAANRALAEAKKQADDDADNWELVGYFEPGEVVVREVSISYPQVEPVANPHSQEAVGG